MKKDDIRKLNTTETEDTNIHHTELRSRIKAQISTRNQNHLLESNQAIQRERKNQLTREEKRKRYSATPVTSQMQIYRTHYNFKPIRQEKKINSKCQ